MLRVLAELTQKDRHQGQLTKTQIREALYRLEDFLGILTDNRVKKKGSENWHFTLTLWSDVKRKHYSLLASFNLSLKRLSAKQLQQFAWLGVLTEDVAITPQMAVTLWELNERQATKALRYLKSKALLLAGTPRADGTPIGVSTSYSG